jgi:hypothetical protein
VELHVVDKKLVHQGCQMVYFQTQNPNSGHLAVI